jgi:hypothetical protein
MVSNIWKIKMPGTNTGYTSGGVQSNLQAPGSLARAVTVDNEVVTEPARCIPSTLCGILERQSQHG